MIKIFKNLYLNYLISAGKILPVARFFCSDSGELGTRSPDLEWSKREGNVQGFVEVQVVLGVVLKLVRRLKTGRYFVPGFFGGRSGRQ